MKFYLDLELKETLPENAYWTYELEGGATHNGYALFEVYQ